MLIALAPGHVPVVDPAVDRADHEPFDIGAAPGVVEVHAQDFDLAWFGHQTDWVYRCERCERCEFVAVMIADRIHEPDRGGFVHKGGEVIFEMSWDLDDSMVVGVKRIVLVPEAASVELSALVAEGEDIAMMDLQLQ